ncbi:PPE family protein [Mycobacterium terramassiliense]|uniref:PPE family protein n=1 Tax=Mycobacterium terramassiliense TaxID=1841859 RepID=A0A2U3N5D2_9MYCO|nr:PPE family protein [Mycobacterium terramassiliense]SPM26737.1 PPE family protein [Mycobacterium terramassiliense]
MVDYGSLPPEINSARIYAGPGVGSLVAAEVAWAGLAGDLDLAAAGHRSVISGLTSGPWLGPSSASLVAAATPFVAWLHGSAEQAAQAASQAGAAAAAYEAAFAATVPPPVVAANRVLLAELIATNLLGQNTPAIAATEAEYFEFWAQDAGAMYGYAASAAAASRLGEFGEPAEVVDPIGLVDQAIAVFKAENDVVQRSAANLASVVNPRVSDILKTLSAPLQAKPIDDWIVANTPLDDVVTLFGKYLSPYVSSLAAMIQSTQSFGQVSNGITAMTSFAKGLAPAAKALEGAASAAGTGTANAASNAGGVAAGLGRALPLGSLSVPPSWAPVNAITNPAVGALTNAVAPAEGMNALPMAPFGQPGGNRYGRILPTYGFKPAVMAKPPAAG